MFSIPLMLTCNMKKGFGLGFTNPVGTGGVLDVGLCCGGVGGVGGEWGDLMGM